MISESALFCLSCTEVKGSPGECIETGHGFERKAGADRKREDGLIEASNHAMCSVTASALEYMYVYT